MLLKHFNEDGFIKAYFEWDVVDSEGRQHSLGRYMHVRHIWVHPDFDFKDELYDFIMELDAHPTNVVVKYIYWIREKNGLRDRPSMLFKRENFVKKAGKYDTLLEKMYRELGGTSMQVQRPEL